MRWLRAQLVYLLPMPLCLLALTRQERRCLDLTGRVEVEATLILPVPLTMRVVRWDVQSWITRRAGKVQP